MINAQFHTERQTGLGGSDLGAILGLNPYRTPYQTWLEKTGRAEPFAGNLQTRFGTHAEQFVADEYCDRTGRRVQRYHSLLRHHTAPLLGHIDRLVIPEGKSLASFRREIRTDLGLECKTAHALAASRGDDWGEAGTDAIPASYLIQCQAYMTLTGCPHWDLAVLFGNSDFQIYHLHHDPELGDYLVDEASRWWRDYVEADTPPPPSSELEARQRWPGHTPGKTLEADATLHTNLSLLARLKAEIRAKVQEEQALKDCILPLLADAEVVTWFGKEITSYRANKASERTDWKALAERLWPYVNETLREQLMAEMTKTVPGARVLRLGKALEAQP